MHAAYTAEQIRAAERIVLAQLPDGALMQRAAHALAGYCAARLGRVYGARVVLLVGAGNNGGDALYAGAELARRGAAVTALLVDPDRAHPAGLAAVRRAGARTQPADAGAIAGADLVLDGIVGIGGRGGLAGTAADLAGAVAHARLETGTLVIAVDVPSGLDASTGEAGDVAVQADATATFGALKTGLLVGAGPDHAGEVRLVDIGLGPALSAPRTRVLEDGDVRCALPVPGTADDKYSRGVVGIAAGSQLYAGAGVLCTGAALSGGAGMVRYLGLAPDGIRARYPEVVVHDMHGGTRPGDVQVQAWVVGPGMGTDDGATALLTDVLRTDVPVIVDADAITLVARAPELVRRRDAPTVLTPHDREFARIADGPGPDRLAAVRAAAADLGAIVLLKGNATIVADAGGQAYVNPTGTPWLATAGSGDVLSGLIGALLAGGLDASLAAAVGAYLHGVAGQQAAASGPPTAVDVLNELRPVTAAIRLGRNGVR